MLGAPSPPPASLHRRSRAENELRAANPGKYPPAFISYMLEAYKTWKEAHRGSKRWCFPMCCGEESFFEFVRAELEHSARDASRFGKTDLLTGILVEHVEDRRSRIPKVVRQFSSKLRNAAKKSMSRSRRRKARSAASMIIKLDADAVVKLEADSATKVPTGDAATVTKPTLITTTSTRAGATRAGALSACDASYDSGDGDGGDDEVVEAVHVAIAWPKAHGRRCRKSSMRSTSIRAIPQAADSAVGDDTRTTQLSWLAREETHSLEHVPDSDPAEYSVSAVSPAITSTDSSLRGPAFHVAEASESVSCHSVEFTPAKFSHSNAFRPGFGVFL